MLHVALIVNNFPPHVGGVEQHCLSLTKSLVAGGHRVTVVTLGRLPGRPSMPGLDIIDESSTAPIAGVLAWPMPGFTARVAKRLADQSVDVVSVHTRFFPLSLLGVLIARRLGVPAVHTEHGSDFVRGVSPLVSVASRVIDLTVGRLTLRLATRILAISTGTQDFVRRLAGRESRLFLNAIDTARYSARREGTYDHVVFVGRLVPGKGWERVIEIAEAVYSDRPGTVFHLVGSGSQDDVVRRRVSESPAAESLAIHGQLSSDEVAALLPGSVFVNPTTLAEGFQTTLLEATAAGAAIVSTPVAAAEYLASVGALLAVRSIEDLNGWVDAVRERLGAPVQVPDATLIASLDWDARGVEFEEHLRGAIEDSRR